jgi:hypothetical protein
MWRFLVLGKSNTHRFDMTRDDDGEIGRAAGVIGRVQQASDLLLEVIVNVVVGGPTWPA